jgi:Tol biopolymer transport system component
VFEIGPSWSPDGERIAFCEPGAGISTMRADGTDVSPVPHMRPSDRFPVWGPDGTLAFTGREGDIWVTNIDGSERRRVAITVEEEFGVWWSPDGSRLVFPSDR